MLRREHNREHHLGGPGGVGGVPVAHGAPPRGGSRGGGFPGSHGSNPELHTSLRIETQTCLTHACKDELYLSSTKSFIHKFKQLTNR